MGRETGGLGLRAWRRLLQVVARSVPKDWNAEIPEVRRLPADITKGNKSAPPAVAPAARASGMYRRACPLRNDTHEREVEISATKQRPAAFVQDSTRARCAPLPPALSRRRPPSENDAGASFEDAR